MRSDSGGIQSIPEHAENSASLAYGFLINKPDDVFHAGWGGHAAQILIVAEGGRTGVLFLAENELHDVEGAFKEVDYRRHAGVRQVQQVPVRQL